ncbi:MAG: aminoglycoside phosphotransferase family protein [Steroidobacter sp.]
MVTETPAAEIEVDVELVRALLRDQHPDLASLTITPFEPGWDNMMFRLGRELAVRLPRRELGAQLIVNEQRWLPGLADRLPLPVPAPLRIGDPGCGYPWRWSVVKWLPGGPADLIRLRADQACVLAQFLKALHVGAPADAPRNPYRGVPLEARAAIVEDRMARLEQKSALISSDIRTLWKTALDAPIDVGPTWIHGDLHPRNVLVESGRLSGVIDWGDVAQGDCATDLASVWMLLPDPSARRQSIDALARVSPATWRRARGWAILFGVTLLDTGLVSDCRNATCGERVLQALLDGP